MAGGKGGSTTTSVEVPEYIQEAAKRNLTRADLISKLGYVPQYGPDVAAFTPLQEAAFGNVAGQAGAFGLQTPAGGAMAGMPAAQEFAGGVRGYSSAPLFEQSVAELAARRPAQKSYIDSFFIDPFSGEYGSNVAAPIDYTTAFPQTPVVTGDTGGGSTGTGGGGIPYIPYVPDIPVETPENVTVVPIDEAKAGDVIAQTDTSALSDAMIGAGLTGIPSNAGQDLQYYNPDIDYTDAFKSELTGQYVGTLDPSAEGIAAIQAAQEALGSKPIDAGFYTEKPIYSASDFPLGTSTQGFDFSKYAADSGTPAGNLMQNQYGSTVSAGYGVGQVDPALAAAAGYTTPKEDYSFMGDLQRSLTDSSYDPEGTVLSRFLDSLASATPSAGPLPPVYDPTANESTAARAREEARIAQNLQQMVTNPEAVLAQYDKADRPDVANQIKQAQTLSAAPRPPSTGNKYEAQAWIKENMGISVDKNDAMDWLAGFQTDWDRLNK